MDVKPVKLNPKKGPKYAAALRYKPGIDQAPVVVAAGQGAIADTIIKLAGEAGIPNHIEPSLAKILSRLEPGTPIPEETYQLVASILAFIWRMDQQYHQR
ncbi:MAG: EscU/YscU/HrcU family type III secretion system export apparatus switch protein [Firmicutes bacterium]|nr:EscU/YscU/HrcU family type III secretion system export apparatus switch protein [Bacillota bacterium]